MVIVWKAVIMKMLLTSHNHLVTFQINVDSFYIQQFLYELLLAKYDLFDDLGLPHLLEKQADGNTLTFYSHGWLLVVLFWLFLIRKNNIISDGTFP